MAREVWLHGTANVEEQDALAVGDSLGIVRLPRRRVQTSVSKILVGAVRNALHLQSATWGGQFDLYVWDQSFKEAHAPEWHDRPLPSVIVIDGK
jgi:hypothetical protein